MRISDDRALRAGTALPFCHMISWPDKLKDFGYRSLARRGIHHAASNDVSQFFQVSHVSISLSLALCIYLFQAGLSHPALGHHEQVEIGSRKDAPKTNESEQNCCASMQTAGRKCELNLLQLQCQLPVVRKSSNAA